MTNSHSTLWLAIAFACLIGSEASAKDPLSPTVGGPYGSLQTFVCSNLGGSYCYSPMEKPPVRAPGDAVPYMDNAARNWGCKWNMGHNTPTDLGGGNWSKSYGTGGYDVNGCGIVFWNYAKQAAYFLSNSEDGSKAALGAQETTKTSITSIKLLRKYTELGQQRGVLGYPISNPTPYGWAGVTYQQFTNGIITYVAGAKTAFHVGGAAEYKALADKYGLHFGISPTSGPAIFGLMEDVGCANLGKSDCRSSQSGRYLKWWDSRQRLSEMIIARTGSNTAVHVPGPILKKWTQEYGNNAPWNGPLGFPITDLLPTGSKTHHQEFEKGSIIWEPRDCSSGTYTARIVRQFRRPISDANLSMLCDKYPPPNNAFSPDSAPISFNVGGRSGAYTFSSSGQDARGWFTGVTIRFDGRQPIDVSGPFYSAWIGGAGGRGNVSDALAQAAPASNWGEPSGNATCVDNPCTKQRQIFGNGTATFSDGGLLWEPASPGLNLPVGFGPYERGYTTQEPSGHRSGDYVKLVWVNKATAPGVTTRIFRSVTPLNGSPTPLTLIQTYPPPTLQAGTGTEYMDSGPTNNAKNCYMLTVSDDITTHSTPLACAYTLDGTTDSNGQDHSIPRGLSQAQLEIGVPTSPEDSGTKKRVMARLISLSGGFNYNFTYLDSTEQDFNLGSVKTYDLRLTGISDVSDIDGIIIESYGDNMRISSLRLMLDGVTVFSKTFDTPVLVHNSHFLGGQRLEIGFDELRSNRQWNNIYNPTLSFLGFTREAFRVKLDSVLAHNVFDAPGAEYYGSRLRDGFPTTLSKPKFAQSDVIHVTQHIVAWAEKGIFCKLDYDLRIHARDIYGNEISPFWGGPYYEWDPPFIHTTEIKAENSAANCSGGGFWGTLFPFVLNGLENDLEKALSAQSPSEIHSAPPKHYHFCFPGHGEGLGPLFWDGGLTICADWTP